MPSRKDKQDDKQERTEEWRRAIHAEIARLSALPLAELAAEVMVKGFGPGGLGADDDAISTGQGSIAAGLTVERISGEFAPERGFNFPLPTPDDYKLLDRITKLIAEGLQQLEHASLIRCQLHTSRGYLDWTATRRGRAALEHGQVPSILQRLE